MGLGHLSSPASPPLGLGSSTPGRQPGGPCWVLVLPPVPGDTRPLLAAASWVGSDRSSSAGTRGPAGRWPGFPSPLAKSQHLAPSLGVPLPSSAPVLCPSGDRGLAVEACSLSAVASSLRPVITTTVTVSCLGHRGERDLGTTPPHHPTPRLSHPGCRPWPLSGWQGVWTDLCHPPGGRRGVGLCCPPSAPVLPPAECGNRANKAAGVLGRLVRSGRRLRGQVSGPWAGGCWRARGGCDGHGGLRGHLAPEGGCWLCLHRTWLVGDPRIPCRKTGPNSLHER